jgi:hypothetical protein
LRGRVVDGRRAPCGEPAVENLLPQLVVDATMQWNLIARRSAIEIDQDERAAAESHLAIVAHDWTGQNGKSGYFHEPVQRP